MQRIIILAIIGLVLISCEKVIEIDIDPSLQSYVIEGKITNSPGPYEVSIFQSTDYFDPSDYPAISNATVIISDNEGVVDTLSMIEDGIYETNSILGIPGNIYSLYIEIDGEEFTSESQMPFVTEIDSLSYEEMLFGGHSQEESIILSCYYKDPEEFENYYRFKFSLDNDPIDGIYLSDDKFNNGLDAEFTRVRADYNPGDTLNVEIWNIDESVYLFYDILAEMSGEGMAASTTPANPVSNISGGVLGYFSAVAIHSTSIVIE